MDEEKVLDSTLEENTLEGNSQGTVQIASDVVATIASLAAAEVPGIVAMSGGVAGGFAEMLGRKNLTKGVKVEILEQNVTVDVFAVVEYGVFIGEVAKAAQAKVKQAVETMTGLNCPTVNIHIQGISFPQKEKEKVEE
ncbi:MAG: Asp23/Gls24 family envelope stress response protein [Firmicutes bacterium]|nr:Asp23/Gls24 family envelope stress response protein [Bacillota bacterium]